MTDRTDERCPGPRQWEVNRFFKAPRLDRDTSLLNYHPIPLYYKKLLGPTFKESLKDLWAHTPNMIKCLMFGNVVILISTVSVVLHFVIKYW